MKNKPFVLRFGTPKKGIVLGCTFSTFILLRCLICRLSLSTYNPKDPVIAKQSSGVHLIQPKSLDFLNPPGVDISEIKPSNVTGVVQLKILSKKVQSQIRNLQDLKNCGKNAILCGHYEKSCGLGCQIHHRAACLMLSYAMGLPLIHETEIDGSTWPYQTPWSEVMLPLGSDCNTTSSTYKWSWQHSSEFYSKPLNASEFAWNPNLSIELNYPLYDGIVAARPLAELVEKFHPNPVLWWSSQFVQYAMRVQPETMKRIRKDQSSIGLRDDCIGLHVRRTDKILEANDSFHNLDEYFSKVKEVDDKVFRKYGSKQQVFIASDDSTVLSSSKEMYKELEIVGYRSTQTLKTQAQRKNYLYEILRDTLSLSRCKTVICGLSSNVCRLILEMQTGTERRLISLERTYSYIITESVISRIHKF